MRPFIRSLRLVALGGLWVAPLAWWSWPAGHPLPAIVAEPIALVLPEPPKVDEAEKVEAEPPPAPIEHLGPPHKVLLPRSRVTPAITRTARELLGRPMGSETVRAVGDRSYAFVVERHYHAPESGLTPVGWHKGVTVYALED